MSDPLQLAPILIVLGRNFPIAVSARKPSQVAGDRFRDVPDSGLSITAFLSLDNTETATAIGAGVSITLVEVGTTADYYAELLGSSITALLAAYADTDTPIYLMATNGTVARQYAECRVVSALPFHSS